MHYSYGKFSFQTIPETLTTFAAVCVVAKKKRFDCLRHEKSGICADNEIFFINLYFTGGMQFSC